MKPLSFPVCRIFLDLKYIIVHHDGCLTEAVFWEELYLMYIFQDAGTEKRVL